LPYTVGIARTPLSDREGRMSVPEVVPDGDSDFFAVWLDGVCYGYGLTLGEAFAVAGAVAVWLEKDWGEFPKPPKAPGPKR
jgi:hypothetical protein